jgi:multiple sugar transport system permease protein
MLSPALLLVAVVVAYPVINAIAISFTDATIFDRGFADFVGFDNYVKAIADPSFARALGNSFLWTFGAVGLQLVFGMFGALALNARIRGRGAIRGLVLIPWATPSVLVALMWLWILDPGNGILNQVLQFFGMQEVGFAWLSNGATALPSLILIDVWQGVPFFAVMILAALQSVPEDSLEAASIDGASEWQKFWRIILPLILAPLLITIVLRLMWTANYIDLALILTQGGPAGATLTLPLSSYLTAYRGNDFGVGTALAVIQAAFLVILAIVYAWRIRKDDVV